METLLLYQEGQYMAATAISRQIIDRVVSKSPHFTEVINGAPVVSRPFDFSSIAIDFEGGLEGDTCIKEKLHGVKITQGEVIVVCPSNLPDNQEDQLIRLTEWCLEHNIVIHFAISSSGRLSSQKSPFATRLRKLARQQETPWGIQISVFGNVVQAAESSRRMVAKTSPPETAEVVMITAVCDNRIGLTDAFLSLFSRNGLSVIEGPVEEVSLATRAVLHFAVHQADRSPICLRKLREDIGAAFKTPAGNTILDYLGVSALNCVRAADLYENDSSEDLVSIQVACRGEADKIRGIVSMIADSGCGLRRARVRPYINSEGWANSVQVTYNCSAISYQQAKDLEEALRGADGFLRTATVRTNRDQKPRRKGA